MNGLPAAAAAALACVALLAACSDDDEPAPGDAEQTELVRIPSASMEPTFTEGDVITLDLDAYDDAEPAVGDVIVFHPPAVVFRVFGGPLCAAPQPRGTVCMEPAKRPADERFIMRVVAVPGDEVVIAGGRAVVDGRVATEPFIRACRVARGCNYPRPATVPPDHYFVLGDNRAGSKDSRFWGPVPLRWIEGRIGD